MPSTSSSHGKAAYSKAHKHNKKSHRLPDVLVLSTEPRTPSKSAPSKSRELSWPEQTGPAPVLATECIPLTRETLESAPRPQELFALRDLRSPCLLQQLAPREAHSLTLDLPCSSQASIHSLMVHVVPLELVFDLSSEDLKGVQGSTLHDH